QEAINNIAKHAQCSTARIALQVQDSLVRVIIADNGKSFRAAEALRPWHKEAGVGLLGMQERVTLFGGTLNIDSSPGQGTKITIEIPLAVARP
ncbi:MAG: ATP-binding protein, partial [Dehalococcoidia bacterium]|nr:ATP-binding protein [Dehalococcoidia bacterium]